MVTENRSVVASELGECGGVGRRKREPLMVNRFAYYLVYGHGFIFVCIYMDVHQKTYQNLHFKHVQFIVCQLLLHRVGEGRLTCPTLDITIQKSQTDSM